MEDQVNITVKFIKQFTKEWNDMLELFKADKKGSGDAERIIFNSIKALVSKRVERYLSLWAI